MFLERSLCVSFFVMKCQQTFSAQQWPFVGKKHKKYKWTKKERQQRTL